MWFIGQPICSQSALSPGKMDSLWCCFLSLGESLLFLPWSKKQSQFSAEKLGHCLWFCQAQKESSNKCVFWVRYVSFHLVLEKWIFFWSSSWWCGEMKNGEMCDSFNICYLQIHDHVDYSILNQGMMFSLAGFAHVISGISQSLSFPEKEMFSYVVMLFFFMFSSTK